MLSGCDLFMTFKCYVRYEEVALSPEFEDEHINEVTTEESIVQELEQAMTKMSDHSRVCFRNALYRLAENSRQQSMVHDGNFRTENSGNMEAETSTIDRAVANLMFYKMDSNIQILSHQRSSLAEVWLFT